MNTARITEFSSGKEIVSSSFYRFSVNDGRLALMFDKSFIEELNSLSKTKIYKVTVIRDDVVLIDTMAMYISYNFAYMNSTTTKELVVADNTVLFNIVE